MDLEEPLFQDSSIGYGELASIRLPNSRLRFVDLAPPIVSDDEPVDAVTLEPADVALPAPDDAAGGATG